MQVKPERAKLWQPKLAARENDRTKQTASLKSKSGNETWDRSSPTAQIGSKIKSHSNTTEDWPQPGNGMSPHREAQITGMGPTCGRRRTKQAAASGSS
jgi:hypothetical protein